MQFGCVCQIADTAEPEAAHATTANGCPWFHFGNDSGRSCPIPVCDPRDAPRQSGIFGQWIRGQAFEYFYSNANSQIPIDVE
jgi:hypothetical protein